MIDFGELPVRIDPMRVEDIPAVLEIEHQSFSAPWTSRAYEYELKYNDLAHYYVARWTASAKSAPSSKARGPLVWLDSLLNRQPPPAPPAAPPIVGYVGFWLMVGEAHVSTIAVAPAYRGRSIGELILATAIDHAMELHATEVTLEVRVSNTIAQELYLKYGFVKAGKRKGYYTDNNEDAIIMTTPPVSSPEYQLRFQRLKEALMLRLREATPGGAPARARSRGGPHYG